MKTRDDWAREISKICYPDSWHTRTGIGAARGCVVAFRGDQYLGYWDEVKSQGHVVKQEQR